MAKVITSILLFSLGVMLAHNIGGSQSLLIRGVTRNPLAIEFTSFLLRNGPYSVYRFEQHVLVHLVLAPYFAVVGISAGAILMPNQSRLGVFVPIGFAIWCSIRLIREFSYVPELGWADLLPFVLSNFTLIPSYLIATAIGHGACGRRLPRFSLLDCVAILTIAAALCAAIVGKSELLISSVLFFGSCWLSVRTSRQWTINCRTID